MCQSVEPVCFDLHHGVAARPAASYTAVIRRRVINAELNPYSPLTRFHAVHVSSDAHRNGAKLWSFCFNVTTHDSLKVKKIPVCVCVCVSEFDWSVSVMECQRVYASVFVCMRGCERVFDFLCVVCVSMLFTMALIMVDKEGV